MQRALARMNDPAAELDTDGRLVYLNAAAERLFTELFGEAAPLGARVPELRADGTRSPIARAVHRALTAQRTVTASEPLSGDRAAELRVHGSDDGCTLLGTIRGLHPAGSVARHAEILDSIREVFVTYDTAWRVTYVNARIDPYLAGLGLTRADLLGRKIWQALPFLADTPVHRAAERAMFERRDTEVELQYPGFDRWFAVRISPTVDGAVSYSRDITERKGAEDEIRRLNHDLERRIAEFETLLEVIPIGIAVALDPSASDIRVNPAFSELVGIPPGSNASATSTEPARQAQRIFQDRRELTATELPMLRAAQGELVEGDEIDVLRADGRHVTLLCYAAPLFDQPGRVRGAVGAFVDVTERRRQEQTERALANASVALNSSLDYALTLATVARMAVPGLADYCLVDLLDDAGQMQRVEFAHADLAKQAALRAASLRNTPDPAWEGHPISAALRSGDATFIPDMTDADLAAFARDPEHLSYLRALAPRSLISVPLIAHSRTLGALTFCHAESGRRYTTSDLALARDLAGRAALAVVNARLYRAAQSELSQRAQAEADLRKWAHIFEHAGWGVIILGADGVTLEAVNPAFARMHGHSADDLAGAALTRLLTDQSRADLPAHTAAAADHGRHGFEAAHVGRDGREFPVLVDLVAIRADDGRFLYYAGNVQDLTERRRGEEQVRQAQKMEAVGRLAGGVAHDFNNMLMIIIGFADFLSHAFDADDPRRLDAEEIRKAAERAAGLTRQLLAFGRQQLVKPQAVDLNAVIRDMELMLRPLLGEAIALTSALAATGIVRADRGQLEQVVMNLALNARDAMAGGGRLSIETRDVVLDEDQAYRQFGLDVAGGEYVRLVVRDTGGGMDAVTRARIFEPFFTTKPPAENSGLGLAVVYGIVSQSGGYIWVESQLLQGTSFTIWLPSVTGDADAAPVAAQTARGGSERVLVVEDEESVRTLA
ncbi:MAG: PAS domain-containing protein, partial [Gemmatimonadota bacterium]